MTYAESKHRTIRARTLVAGLAAVAVFAFLVPAGANAKNENANKDKGGNAQKEQSSTPQPSDDIGDVIARSIIDSSSRALIEEYFQSHPQPVEALPPGIAKNVARGKPLPPGIAKKSIPAPLQTELRNRDSSVGKIVDALIVGDDVALVDAATGVVVDILVDVVRAQ